MFHRSSIPIFHFKENLNETHNDKQNDAGRTSTRMARCPHGRGEETRLERHQYGERLEAHLGFEK